MSSTIYGVANLELATDDTLVKLLDQIGRNGDTAEGTKKAEQINSILESRKVNGVTFEQSGVHHSH